MIYKLADPRSKILGFLFPCLAIFLHVILLIGGGIVAFAAELEFHAEDGTLLSGKLYTAENPRALLLFAHGLQSNCRWFDISGMGDYLAAHGITVLAFDRRGSGSSVRVSEALGIRQVPGHVNSATEFLQDMRAAYALLLAQDPSQSLPVHILGNSFAARIVIPFAAENPNRLTSIILEVPALYIRSEIDYNWAQRLRIGLLDRIGMGQSLFDQGPLDRFATPLANDLFLTAERETDFDGAENREGIFWDRDAWFAWINSESSQSLYEVSRRFLLSANELTLRTEAILRSGRELAPMFMILAGDDLIVDNQKTITNIFDTYRGYRSLEVLPSGHYISFGSEQRRYWDLLLEWIEARPTQNLIQSSPNRISPEERVD